MIQSLYAASSGMIAQQTQLDIISNNISNANTIGYKKQHAEFADLMYQSINQVKNSQTSMEVGLGVKSTSISREFTQGDLKKSGNDLDIAISGKGFFKLQLGDGIVAYTRNGTFRLNHEGSIVNANGNKMIPEIRVPKDAATISISKDGIVSVKKSGDENMLNIGQIKLANFVNPSGLRSLGDNNFSSTEYSGSAITSMPGQNGIGETKQSYVEISNVELVREMTNLITTQRSYEANAKVITTTDEMLKIVNKLKSELI